MRRLLVQLLLALFAASYAKKIVTVGDSWAEYSGNAFTDFCDGATQINRGIGGTTGMQWLAGTGETNFAKALAAAGTLGKDDVVVFSLGGNDFIPGCTKPLATLTKQIKDTMNALGKALGKCEPNCPKIVTFGYPKSCDAKEKECPTQASLAPLEVAIKDAAKAMNVQYVPTQFIPGGSKTAWATPASFGMCYKGTGKDGVPCMQDCIHLNQQGYCKIVTDSTVQAALGCRRKSYQCSKVSKDLDRKIRWGAKCTSFPCKGSPYTTPPPPSPTPPNGCKDNDAGVVTASGGIYKSCAQLMKSEHNCEHVDHGAQIRALCAASCKCDAKCCAGGAAQVLFSKDADAWEEDTDGWVEAMDPA